MWRTRAPPSSRRSASSQRGQSWSPWSCAPPFGRRLEPVERVGPEPLDPVTKLHQALRLDAVQSSGPFLPLAHEARSFQYTEMLRDGRPADRQPLGKLADGVRPLSQELEDRSPRRIRQRLERNSVSHRLR